MAREGLSLVEHENEYYKKYAAIRNYGFDINDDEQQSPLKNTVDIISLPKDTPMWVLAIGTSDGINDIPIIDALETRGNQINYIVVEPFECAVQKFKQLAASKKDKGKWKNITFRFHQETVESFLSESGNIEGYPNFDFIHTLHCAYHFLDPGQVYINLYGRLNKGGSLLITLVFGPWEKLYREVPKYLGYPTVTCCGSKNFQDILQKKMPDLKIQTATRQIEIDIDQCFTDEASDGDDILDFLIQVSNARKTIPKETYNEVMLFLKEECCHITNGKICFNSCEEEFVITKV